MKSKIKKIRPLNEVAEELYLWMDLITFPKHKFSKLTPQALQFEIYFHEMIEDTIWWLKGEDRYRDASELKEMFDKVLKEIKILDLYERNHKDPSGMGIAEAKDNAQGVIYNLAVFVENLALRRMTPEQWEEEFKTANASLGNEAEGTEEADSSDTKTLAERYEIAYRQFEEVKKFNRALQIVKLTI
jgi:hypothetical protein